MNDPSHEAILQVFQSALREIASLQQWILLGFGLIVPMLGAVLKLAWDQRESHATLKQSVMDCQRAETEERRTCHNKLDSHERRIRALEDSSSKRVVIDPV